MTEKKAAATPKTKAAPRKPAKPKTDTTAVDDSATYRIETASSGGGGWTFTKSDPLIHSKMVEALRKAPAISKSAKNVQSGYAARSIDDVLDGLHSVFADVGIYAVPTVVGDPEYLRTETVAQTGKRSVVTDVRMRVRYSFYAEDGSSISAEVVVEGRDYADKASTKALSQAYKYAMLQTFSIALSESDPDTETIEVEAVPATPVEKIRAAKHPEYVAKLLVLEAMENDKTVAAEVWRKLRLEAGIEEDGGELPVDTVLALWKTFDDEFGPFE